MISKILSFFIGTCFIATGLSAELSTNPATTKLKIRQPNWRLERVTTFTDGTPKKNIMHAPIEGEKKEAPVKELIYNKSGKLIQETDLCLIKGLATFHGPSVSYDEKGRIIKVDFYQDGFLHGESKDIYPNGMIKKISYYDRGVKQGPSTVYFDNGEIAKSSHFINDKLDSNCITYYPNGIRESHINYEKGVLQGEAIYWYENGNFKSKKYYTYGLLNDQRLTKALTNYYPENVIQEVQSFTYGLPSGVHIKYHPNGKESFKVSYKNGKKVGLELTFSEENTLVGEGEYADGVPIGKHYLNNNSGNLKYLAQYNHLGVLEKPIAEYDDSNNKIVEYSKDFLGLQGNYTEWYETGTIKKKYCYRNDYFDGQQEEFFENGQLKLKCLYVNQKKQGSFEEWFEAGNEALKATYNQGIKTGSFIVFYADGKLLEESHFEKDGKLDGEVRFYEKNGQLVFQATYTHGLKNGITQEWYTNSKLKKISHYSNNMLDGKQELFFENGNQALKATYIRDQLDGTYTSWFENGDIHETKQFVLGKPVGTHIENYPRNENETFIQVAKETLYKDGKLDGEQKSFYRSGKIEALLSYSLNILNGKKALFDDSGNILEEATYEMGLLSGRYFTIKESGNQVIYHYKNNLLEGLAEIYFPQHPLFGKIKALEAYYEKGLLQGEVIEYNEAGTRIISTFYQNGLKNGPCIFYGHDGAVISSTYYRDDLQYGVASEFFRSSRLQSETYLVDDEKHGDEITYYDDSQKLKNSSKSYKYGLLNGFWQEWDAKGNLIYQAEYVDGKREGMVSKYDSDGNPYLLHRYADDKLVEKFDCE